MREQDVGGLMDGIGQLEHSRLLVGEALGEVRSGVGLQVANIAASHGLDVEDDLARFLPDP